MNELGVFARARVMVSRGLLGFLQSSPSLLARLAKTRAGEVDGRTLDVDLAAILAVDDLDNGSDLRGCTPTAARAKLVEQLAIVQMPMPPGVTVEDRVIAGPAGDLRARIYVPEGLEKGAPGIAYFHGGGFVTCDIGTHDVFCRQIALGARVRVVSFDYRLAPEARFPAAVDDALCGVRWLLANAEDLGIDPSRVAVMGDSAGGNLSAVVSIRTRNEARRPALQVLLYPAMDATCALPSHQSMGTRYFLTSVMIDWYYENYLGPDQELRRHPDMSPLLAPDVAGCAPALVYVGGFDPLRDEGYAFAKRLTDVGIAARVHELRSLTHGFALMTALKAPRAAVDAIIDDVGRSLRATPIAPLA